jgi:hypothetical protein
MYGNGIYHSLPCLMEGLLFGKGPYGLGVYHLGGGGGGDIPADTSTTIRYADYIEKYHQTHLERVQAKVTDAIDEINLPYVDYEDIDPDDAFFGSGYVMASYPSLYDMYGKFMAGLDIETLWTQAFEETVGNSAVSDLVSAEAALMDDEIETTAIPRMQTGMRDMNSVMASTYVIGKAIIEDARTKALEKFSAELKYRLIPVAEARWQTHLQWNQTVVSTFAEIMKFYFSTRIDVDEVNHAMRAKQELWAFNAFEFERASLGTLQGATNTRTDVAGASTGKKVISGALSGAAMGAMVGSQISAGGAVAGASQGSTYGWWGAAIGAIVGGVAGAL